MIRTTCRWHTAAALAPLVGIAGNLLASTPSRADDFHARLQPAASPAVAVTSAYAPAYSAGYAPATTVGYAPVYTAGYAPAAPVAVTSYYAPAATTVYSPVVNQVVAQPVTAYYAPAAVAVPLYRRGPFGGLRPVRSAYYIPY